MNSTLYQVTGMTCGHCEHAVKSEVAKVPGIETVAVSSADGILRIESAEPLDDAAILAAVDEAGYSAVRA